MFWYEPLKDCCFEFHPCDDGEDSLWEWGDGSPNETAGPGESIIHCFCEGRYDVRRTVVIDNRNYIFADYVLVEDCSFIEADFDYDIIDFSGCTNPNLCCCGDCDSVVLSFTDTSIGSYSIVDWSWKIFVGGNLHSGSTLQNPTFTIGGGRWNAANTVLAQLEVTDDCGNSDSIIITIKGNC